MFKRVILYTINLTILLIISFFLQYNILNITTLSLEFKTTILPEIYLFIFILHILHFVLMQWLFAKWPKYSGIIFTAFSLLKMGVAIVYLWQYIYADAGIPVVVILNFIPVYFVALIFEVITISKNMTKFR